MGRTAWISMVVVGTLLVGAASVPGDEGAAGDEAAVAAVLDDFHAAAAAADGPRYFGHFAPEGVFLGTDATERWTLEEFKAFAQPYFEKGKGWAYTPKARHVHVAGDAAWFDEALESASYGACRGSGVLRRIDGDWKVAQYNLSIPIPNDLAKEFVARIRGGAAPAAKETVIYLVRHAEREPGPRDSDPPLDEKGRRRAEALAKTLSSVPLAAIYATPTRRTRETVAPTAKAMHQVPLSYAPAMPERIAARLRIAHVGQAVLVCGHSDTIPELLNQLGVEGPVEIGAEEHDSLFIVTLRAGQPTRLQRLHYGE